MAALSDGSRQLPDAVDGPSWARRGLGGPGRRGTSGTATVGTGTDGRGTFGAGTGTGTGTGLGLGDAGTTGSGAVPRRPPIRSRTPRTRAISSSVRNGLAR